MGNGGSRDSFAGVLPSASAAKVSGTAKSDSPPISDAWSAGSRSPSTAEDEGKQPAAKLVGNVPHLVGKINPPGHALQLEENTTRLSLEASEVVRAFNSVERTEDHFMIPESVRKSRTLDAYADVCSEILPGFLYVSNFQVARDVAKLRALGITHVVNCCGELKHYEDGVEQPTVPSELDRNTLKLLLRDDANENLTPFLPQVMEYIAACRERSQNKENSNKDKVLIHCHQGVSRSCAFAIAYVMMEQCLPYHDAAATVKRQRAISSPNAAFICQLLEWEKDLQAIRSTGSETIFSMVGLYRLAPHSNYDPDYLVLKRCYDPNAGSARQRQNLARIRTPDDEQNFLWSSGTFVYQSPAKSTDLIIWHGARCVIPDAVMIARKLAGQILHVHALVHPAACSSKPVNILEVHENSEHPGTDIDHFNYAAELKWGQEKVSKMPRLHLPTNGNTSDAISKATSNDSHHPENLGNSGLLPELFILESLNEESGEDLWDQLTNYDSEDLTQDNAFLLYSVQAEGGVISYVWLGASCALTPEKVVEAAQKQIQSLQSPAESRSASTTVSLVVEHQNQESEAFWQLFEAGY